MSCGTIVTRRNVYRLNPPWHCELRGDSLVHGIAHPFLSVDYARQRRLEYGAQPKRVCLLLRSVQSDVSPENDGCRN